MSRFIQTTRIALVAALLYIMMLSEARTQSFVVVKSVSGNAFIKSGYVMTGGTVTTLIGTHTTWPATLATFTFPSNNGPGAMSVQLTMGIDANMCTTTHTIYVDASRPCEDLTFTLSCGTYFTTYTVNVKPTITWTAPYPWEPDGTYCEDQSIILKSIMGIQPPYKWEYRDSKSSTFKAFARNPGTGYSITTDAAGIFGSNATDAILNNPVYFRVTVGKCPPLTTPAPISFQPKALVASAMYAISPVCSGEYGTLMLYGFNRTMLTNEVAVITIRRKGTAMVVKQLTNITPVRLPLTIPDIPPGSYEVLVESSVLGNAIGCGTATYTPVDVTVPAAVTIASVAVQHPSCPSLAVGPHDDASITLTATGGTGPYTYSINNGAYSTSNLFNNLTAGTYAVRIKDSRGCESPGQSVTLTEPLPLVLTVDDVQHASCFNISDGAITAHATGGTEPYRYAITGQPFQNTALFESLPMNTYPVQVRDQQGCLLEIPVTVKGTPSFDVVLHDLTPASCGTATGSMEVEARGETGPYSFTWFDDTGQPINTGASIRNLVSGLYTVQVEDALHCIRELPIQLPGSTQPRLITREVVAPTCAGRDDGQASVDVSDGTQPYEITWSDTGTGYTRQGLAPGTYTVTVRDKASCVITQQLVVPAANPMIINVLKTVEPNCSGGDGGVIEVVASHGKSPYTFHWQHGAEGAIIDHLMAGTYYVTATDATACTANSSIVLDNFVLELSDETSCPGVPVIKAAPVAAQSFHWSGPDGFESFESEATLLTPGTYTLTLTRLNGCTHSNSFTLQEDINALHADFLVTSTAYVGDTVVVIDISWPPPNTITWEVSAGGVILDSDLDLATLRFDKPGTYTVTMNAKLSACTATYSSLLTILEKPEEPVDIRQMNIINAVNIHPNPVTSALNIALELSREQDVELSLYHLQQNRLLLTHTLTGASNYQTTLAMDHLESGLYLLVIRAEREVKTWKIVKN